MKRMLINATQSEELRVAVVDGQKLLELEIEFSLRPEKKGNIYKAVITRVEQSLDAVFVDYGEERHGFLPFKEIAKSYFNDKKTLTVGQKVIVQVSKEERGNKGAAMTTYLSLAGRYVVLMPLSPRTTAVSKRGENSARNETRETLELLDIPDDMGIIVRTAGIGRDVDELTWDLNYLRQLWSSIDAVAKSNDKPELIYQESNLIIRAIRDYFQPDINEILIDTDEIYAQAHGFMSYVMPTYVDRVKLYKDSTPLFSRFQVEHQIETAYSRTVALPSGGSIVIDRTEALVAIDINSSKSTRGNDVEQTAYTTNLEAAEEIARQLRLRDLGGLIVIDFIDMDSPAHQREIENKVRESMRYDRARVQISKLSRFGLLEISRQRLQPSLGESSNVVCPRCGGAGNIRSTDSFALQAIREIENEALKENSGRVSIQVPVEVASFLLNEKRNDIQRIEMRSGVNIIVVPNKYLETPHYHIERLRHDELNELTEIKSSYQLVEETKPVAESDNRLVNTATKQQKAKVDNFLPDQPAPIIKTEKAPVPTQVGFFAWLKSLFASDSSEETSPKKKPKFEERSERSERHEKGKGRENRGNFNRSKDGRDRENKNKFTAEGKHQREDRSPKKDNSAKDKNDKRIDKIPMASENIANNLSNKENREVREPRESREPRDKEGSRSRYLGRNREGKEGKKREEKSADVDTNLNKSSANSGNKNNFTTEDHLPIKVTDNLPIAVSEPITPNINDKSLTNTQPVKKNNDRFNYSAPKVESTENNEVNVPVTPVTTAPVKVKIETPESEKINFVEKEENIRSETTPPAVSTAPATPTSAPAPVQSKPLVIELPPHLKMVETIKSVEVNLQETTVKLGRVIEEKPAEIVNVPLQQVETHNK